MYQVPPIVYQRTKHSSHPGALVPSTPHSTTLPDPRQTKRMDAKDDRILQITDKALSERIQKACRAAGLTGTFGGFSPRNGMTQDLTRSGVRVTELRKAKGWGLMATTHSEQEDIARNGAVAQWYAQRETETKAAGGHASRRTRSAYPIGEQIVKLQKAEDDSCPLN